MSHKDQVAMLAYIYFVSFEPPKGDVSSFVFTLPKPIRGNEDLRRIEKMLNAGREQSDFSLMRPTKTLPYRITNVSLLEEAEIPLTPEQVAEIKQAREENRKKREAAVEGASEVIQATRAPQREES